MMLLIVSLSCWCFDVGASMRSSRWTSNHQNGANAFIVVVEMIDSIILACILWNRFFLRKRLQVDQKCGGLWL